MSCTRRGSAGTRSYDVGSDPMASPPRQVRVHELLMSGMWRSRRRSRHIRSLSARHGTSYAIWILITPSRFCKRQADSSALWMSWVAQNMQPCIYYTPALLQSTARYGVSKFDEPFQRLIHQGVILGEDGNKMSKSKGNTVSPDEYIERYGSDVLRLYLGFGFAYTEGGPWSDNGVRSMDRLVGRLTRLAEDANLVTDAPVPERQTPTTAASKDLNYARHFAIAVLLPTPSASLTPLSPV